MKAGVAKDIMFVPFATEIIACWITESSDYPMNLPALYRIKGLVQIQLTPCLLAKERVKQCLFKNFPIHQNQFFLSLHVMDILNLLHTMVTLIPIINIVLPREIVHRQSLSQLQPKCQLIQFSLSCVQGLLV